MNIIIIKATIEALEPETITPNIRIKIATYLRLLGIIEDDRQKGKLITIHAHNLPDYHNYLIYNIPYCVFLFQYIVVIHKGIV